MADAQIVEQHGQDFLSVLVQLRNGTVVHHFGDQIKRLVDAVRETGKSGSLSINLKIAPLDAGSEALTVEATGKLNIPQPSLGKTVFFANDEGMLLRDNPKQLKFEIQDEKDETND